MPTFAVALTEESVSLKELETKKVRVEKVSDVPIGIYLQIKNAVRSSRLKKPMCTARTITLSFTSPIYGWFNYEKDREITTELYRDLEEF